LRAEVAWSALWCGRRLSNVGVCHHISGKPIRACRSSRSRDAAAQHGAVADRLKRSDFVSEKQENGLPIYRSDTFQPAAKRQSVSPQLIKLILI
jgi:hypothetical protein